MKTQPDRSDLNHSKLCVEQVIAEVMGSVHAPVKTFEQELIERINAITVECFHSFKKQHQINVKPMTKNEAVNNIKKLYRDKYVDWNKNDLMEALVLTLAVLAVESLHDELI